MSVLLMASGYISLCFIWSLRVGAIGTYQMFDFVRFPVYSLIYRYYRDAGYEGKKDKLALFFLLNNLNN